MEADSNQQGHNQGQNGFGLGSGGDYSFDGSLNSIMKEQTQKLPWLVSAVNFQQGSRIIGSPRWKLHDPTTLATLWHHAGSSVTLELALYFFESEDDYSNVLHNIFWAKNHEQKGFHRLVKDEEIDNKNLLITGKREEDKRASELGWSSWPWFDEDRSIEFGVPNVKQKSNAIARNFRNQANAYDLDDTNHFIGILRDRGVMSKEAGTFRHIGWGNAPKRSILYIINQLQYDWVKNSDWLGDDINTINPNNGLTHYLIFSDYTTEEINQKFIQNNSCQSLAELVGKLNGVLVRLGPDALELMNSQTKEQKERSESETKESRETNKKSITDQNLKDVNITRAEFEALTTAFTDPAKIDNIIQKLAHSNPVKMAELIDKMFDTIHEKTAEAMFKQIVNHNPVFTEEEKQTLITAYQAAPAKAEKKKLWQQITSGLKQKEAHQNKSSEQKEQIFQDQVNNNPRYGPIGVDNQERRDRLNEPRTEQLYQEENNRFTQGQNAYQWANYFQDNANRQAGAGDRSVGTESDNNFNGQFSFADSLKAINQLKNIGSMKPVGMEEGMASNKPYWGVVMSHPLTYIFSFIGVVIAIMATATKKR
ncbi:MAG: hypothetical protein GBAus27B_000510 [Mycoplasmataceae bacterium]|nr:MAG: hypothetical protein GBAus27B_000510 [Mycoplasmataceae bacterium]